MYVVIFRARVAQFDSEYFQTAERMRELAIEQYGCLEFVASTEDDLEIAISYWRSLDDIANWKRAPEHLLAQQKGKEKWYKSFEIEIAEIKSTNRSSA